jgi:hypothetical protein
MFPGVMYEASELQLEARLFALKCHSMILHNAELPMSPADAVTKCEEQWNTKFEQGQLGHMRRVRRS